MVLGAIKGIFFIINLLNYLCSIFYLLSDMKHFARIIEFGQHKQYKFIVTELLGPNLRHYQSL
jgi:hypothetical protein